MKVNNDYETIMALLSRNDDFLDRKIIEKHEYLYNNLFLCSKLNIILNQTQNNILQDFFCDNLNLRKFRLSIEILKTAPN